MSKKVILYADSTCDLGPALCEQYGVHLMPYHIGLDGKEYRDNVDIHVKELYDAWYERKLLPKTSAISTGEYIDAFTPWLKDGYEIVHINLGSALSASYQNCVLAAQELEGVYPIDSKNLSSGTGHLVIEAAKLRDQGASAAEIQAGIQAMTGRVHASFILDTLEFMHAGGRCSTVAMLGANMLSLKPCIEVNNESGSMSVGKKYRGRLLNVEKQYIRDKLAAYRNIRTDKIFITYSLTDEEYVNSARETIESVMHFDRIYTTNASCTIASHCGPNTLGILFMTED